MEEVVVTHTELVPMSKEEQEWVKNYLSQDAATNHEQLPNVDTWLIEEWSRGGRYHVDIYETVGGTKLHEDGFSFLDSFDKALVLLQTKGFPVEDYS